MNNQEPVLEITNLGIDFSGLTAVNDLNMTVYNNQIFGLIGPNGAGKTTVFNMITRVYRQTRGSIRFCGQSIDHMNTVQASKAGIARTFQNIRLFSHLSVRDNVKVGLGNSIGYGTAVSLLHTPSYFKAEKAADQEAMELLSIFGLDSKADLIAGNLPYGAQRRLEIARAMATHPRLLLLDEPAAGMNPQETEELMAMIRTVRDHFHIAILLIEHDMRLVMGICEHIVVLNYGILLAEGTADEIQHNPEVIKAYIGE